MPDSIAEMYKHKMNKMITVFISNETTSSIERYSQTAEHQQSLHDKNLLASKFYLQ